MRTGSVCFLLGVVLACRLEELPPVWVGVALLPVVLLLRSPRWRWLACAGCGLLWLLLRAGVALQPALDPALEGRTLYATGRIASLPSGDTGRSHFDFDIRELRDGHGRILHAPRRARLGWYRNVPRLEPGDEWRLTVRLRRPLGFSNPGGFDYEGWLFQQGVRASGYVVGGTPMDSRRAGHLNVDRARLWLRDRILARFPDESRAPLLIALAVGDASGVAASDWQTLTRTGTSHLLAISGLHIGLVAGIGFFVVRRTWPLLGRAPLWLPAPQAGAIGAAVGAAIYAALAGFAVPTQRALIMVLVWTISAGLCRNTSFTQVLAAALLAVLLFDPFAVLAPGFWLSFGAVAAIGFGMGGRTAAPNWWRRWGRVHLVVAIGLLPQLILWFHQMPALTVPANLVAVPWISLLTVPLVLLACLVLPLHAGSGQLLLELALWSIELLWPFLELLADSRLSVMSVPESAPYAMAMALAGAAILTLPRGIPGRWLGAMWMLPLLIPAHPRMQDGEFQVVVLDVGQGLAALVRTRSHALLYDAGPRFGPDFSAGTAVILPYLRQAGIPDLDVLMLSHGDSDHAGGLDDVLRGIVVKRVLAGTPDAVPRAAVEACVAGQGWRWDGVDFEVLHPRGSDGRLRGNNRSCVLRIRNDARAALLTGDIEEVSENMLLSSVREHLRAQVLIAPHHGSRTSSSVSFVDAVRPDVVVFAAGFRNRFGFPKQDIIARYQQHGARILDTARSGAIDIRLQRAAISIHTHRQAHRRFWHSRI